MKQMEYSTGANWKSDTSPNKAASHRNGHSVKLLGRTGRLRAHQLCRMSAEQSRTLRQSIFSHAIVPFSWCCRIFNVGLGDSVVLGYRVDDSLRTLHVHAIVVGTHDGWLRHGNNKLTEEASGPHDILDEGLHAICLRLPGGRANSPIQLGVSEDRAILSQLEVVTEGRSSRFQVASQFRVCLSREHPIAGSSFEQQTMVSGFSQVAERSVEGEIEVRLSGTLQKS